MDERDMTLLRSFDFMRDIEGWFWSEKLDGCRAYWDGSEFWTRDGNVIKVPKRIRRRMPRGVHVDGEMWAGRGNFQTARVAVQYNAWTDQTDFVAFDFPQVVGNYEQRMASGKIFDVQLVEVGIVGDMQELGRIFGRITCDNGEGIVVRNPRVKNYERKRTQNCLRIKDVA